MQGIPELAAENSARQLRSQNHHGAPVLVARNARSLERFQTIGDVVSPLKNRLCAQFTAGALRA
jgi:hypothetical protein